MKHWRISILLTIWFWVYLHTSSSKEKKIYIWFSHFDQSGPYISRNLLCDFHQHSLHSFGDKKSWQTETDEHHSAFIAKAPLTFVSKAKMYVSYLSEYNVLLTQTDVLPQFFICQMNFFIRCSTSVSCPSYATNKFAVRTYQFVCVKRTLYSHKKYQTSDLYQYVNCSILLHFHSSQDNWLALNSLFVVMSCFY